MPSKNALCHFEISSTEPKKAAQFYKRLFDWKMNFDMGEDYIFFKPENGVGGAISRAEKIIPGNSFGLYIEVDEVDDYLKKAVSLGAGKVSPKKEIPNIGWYAQFSDLDGNVVGLFMSK